MDNTQLSLPLRSPPNKTAENIPLIKPPIAHPEVDDPDDDRPTVTSPSPGVDDGFFHDNPGREVEIIPRGGQTPPADKPGDENPFFPPSTPRPYFPNSPGYGPDVEVGGVPDLDSIPDVNVYQHKKTLAQGMMDLALFSANANQLRYVLESYGRHPYYYASVVLISISLLFQVVVGIGLIWNATYNVKDEKEICVANKISNFTIIGIFLVTVINVFISAFGVANPSTTG